MMKKGLLTGLARGWFQVFKEAENSKEICIINRGHREGVLVDKDYWALKYQIYAYRALRAQFSLTGQQILSMLPAPDNKSPEQAALEETFRVFIKAPRKKALEAKKLLKERNDL